MTSVLLFALLAMQAQPDRAVLKKMGMTIVQPMDGKATARTRAKVDAALAKAGASTAFDNVTTPNGGLVRHRASGLTCPLSGRGQEVAVQPGDAALCRVRNGVTVYETRVSRVPPSATLASVHDAALRGAQAEPGFAPAGLTMVARPRPASGRPEHRTIAYTSRVDGRPTRTRLLVGLVDGWLLTERTVRPDGAASPAGGLNMTDVMGEAMFGSKMKPAF